MNSKLLTECQMCYELYDEGQRIPRNLTCGHTYCEYCLNQVYLQKQRIECPTCRTKLDIGLKPNKLSKNYIASDLAVKERQAQNMYEYCEIHGEPINFYCENDEKNICSDCIVEHPGHKFKKLQFSISLLQKQVNELGDKVNERIDNINKQKEDFENIKKSLNQKKKNKLEYIEQQFGKIINQIQKRKEKVKQDVQQYFSHQLEDIDFEIVLQESICQQYSEFTKSIEEINKNLKSHKYISDNQLQLQIKEIEENIKNEEKQLQKNQQLNQFYEMPTLEINSEIISYEIQKLGEFKKIVNGRICFFGEKNLIIMYDIKKNEWYFKSLKQNFAEFNYYSSAVSLANGDIMIIGNQIFVVGGYNNQKKEMLNKCEVYDIELDTWTEIPSTNQSKCAIAIAQLNNTDIYIFGGFDGQNRISAIEKYNIQEKKWKILDIQLQQPLSNSAAKSISNTEIIIIGGGNDNGFLEQTILFNVETKQFSDLPPMREGRDLRNKLVQFNNEVYAIGGHNNSGASYNIKTKQWKDISPYNEFIQDHLDSWCCALSIEYEGEEQEYEKVFSQLQPQINENNNNNHWIQQQQQGQGQQNQNLQQQLDDLDYIQDRFLQNQLRNLGINSNTNPIRPYNPNMFQQEQQQQQQQARRAMQVYEDILQMEQSDLLVSNRSDQYQNDIDSD